MYFAVIGDIVDSKSIKDRSGFQKKLAEVLEQINMDFSSTIAANFIITLGDEFQGLLTSPQHLLDILSRIKFRLFPVKVRFGIGAGMIETEINREMAIGADGPAYHHARSAINDIKTGEKGKMSTSMDTKIGAELDSAILDLVNSNLCLCTFIESKWTSKQRILIEEDMLSDQSQREIASKFNLAQSSVQRRFKNAGYYDYLYARKTIHKILINKWGDRDAE